MSDVFDLKIYFVADSLKFFHQRLFCESITMLRLYLRQMARLYINCHQANARSFRNFLMTMLCKVNFVHFLGGKISREFFFKLSHDVFRNCRGFFECLKVNLPKNRLNICRCHLGQFEENREKKRIFQYAKFDRPLFYIEMYEKSYGSKKNFFKNHQYRINKKIVR